METIDSVINGEYLEERLLSHPLLYQQNYGSDDDDEGKVIYRVSFKETEDIYVNYQTVRWLLLSLLLILAWGVGFVMLVCLPWRRRIIRQEFQARKLYITSDAVVYKVVQPSFIPWFGHTRRENHMLLRSVTDVVIDQGWLQTLFGLFSVRIENGGIKQSYFSDDYHISGVANANLFKKVVLTRVLVCKRNNGSFKDPGLMLTINNGEESSRSPYICHHFKANTSDPIMSPALSLEALSSFKLATETVLLRKIEDVGKSLKRVRTFIECQQFQKDENDASDNV